MPRPTRRSDKPSAAELTDSSATPSLTDVGSPSVSDSAPAETAARARRPSSRVRKDKAPRALDLDTAEITNAGPVSSESEPLPQQAPGPVRRVRKPKVTAATVPADEVASGTASIFDNVDSADAGGVAKAEPDTDVRVSRRRVGGRRTAAEAVAAATGIPAPIAAVSTPESTAPSERSRRRRGSRRSSPAPAAADSVVNDEELPEAVVDDLTTQPVPHSESIDSTEPRKSRRSRRGGRRKTGRETDVETATDSEELEEIIPAEQDDDVGEAVLAEFAPTPVWRAPRLVPLPSDLGLETVVPRVSARYSPSSNSLIINDSPVEPHVFFVNADEAEDQEIVRLQVEQAAEAGIHIHSGVVYLPFKNSAGKRSFARTDELLEQLLSADPSANLILRLQCVPTNFWARTHSDQMARFSNGSEGDVSYASTTFWRDCVDAIAALVAHFADPETKHGDRVIGLHLDKGEWFFDSVSGYDLSDSNRLAFRHWLHAKYQNVYALRAAWYDGSIQFETAEIPTWTGAPSSRAKEEVVLYLDPKDRRTVDYNSFVSDLMAEAITGVAEAIKALTSGHLLVGVSYGYTFEFATRSDSGHMALAAVFQSPAIDIVAGPNSYQTRMAGAAGAFASPVDSARLHQKLWMVEDDTKTHLAKEETPDTFNPRIGSPQDTISVQRRNVSTAILHQCGICWMDLWGKGWLNSAEVWNEIRLLKDQYALSQKFVNGVASIPEVAVIVDEASYAYVRSDSAGAALQQGLITKTRELLSRSGASIGYYLQSDVASLPDETKLIIFINPIRVTTQERQAIREKLQKQGKTLVWMYAPSLFDEKGESPTEVAEITGMPLKAQPWNSKIGSIFTEDRHPIIERLHGGKRIGSEEILNPSYAEVDPAAIVLAEYSQSSTPSIAAKINEGGWKSVFVGEPHVTGELLRGIYRFAGVHTYDLQDDVVHAEPSGLLLIHAPYTGQRTVHLPKPAAVYSVYERRLVAQNSSTFRVFLRGRTSHFFLWGDIDRIAESLGKTADELRQAQAAFRAEREATQRQNIGRQDEERDSDDVSDQETLDSGSNMPLLAHPTGTLSVADIEIQQIEGFALTPDGVQEFRSTVFQGTITQELLAEDIDGLPTDEISDDDTQDAVGQPETMSPSRRRRWHRKRNAQATKEQLPPNISMEELLSDLPPRKPQQNMDEQ